MKVFFIVGEDSGDVIAANMIKQLKQKSNAECMGVGGPLMEAAGFNTLLEMDELTAFGIFEALPKVPKLLKIKDSIISEIEKINPDVVVTVDFPEFNFILAKGLKTRGKYKGKLVHYVAPSVWAWRESRAKSIAKYYDGILCLFPMEVEYFTKSGMKAECVGHPIVENFQPIPKEKSYRVMNDIPDDTIILGLFFGSRISEFKNLKTQIMAAAKYVVEYKKKVHIIVPTLKRNEFLVQSFLHDLGAPVFVSANENFKWTAFQACDVAIAASGTVGLELAYANIPHVITYKLNSLTYFLLKLMVKIKKAHLVNIILGRDVVPEFIQKDCEPEKIAAGILEILRKQEKYNTMMEGFDEFQKLLGKGQDLKPSERAAQFVISIAEKAS